MMMLSCSKRLVRVGTFINRKTFSAWEKSYHEVSFAEPGTPAQVLQYLSADDPPPKSASVNVEIHHVPWNPADVNAVQGTYASPYPRGSEPTVYPSFVDSARTVAGSEGYGRVVQLNTEDSDLEVGDWVTFGRSGLGSLRSSIWLEPQDVIPIRRGPELFESSANNNAAGVATLFQLGGTALGLLRSFVDLRAGDTIVQNAGNSGVGFVVSQLAKTIVDGDLQVVSVVRRGDKTPEQFEALVERLQTAGKADVVLAQEDWINNRQGMRELVKQWKSAPVLALNAVGGSSSGLVLSLLGQGGTHVTYGGMSMRPVSVSTSQLIFKDVHVRGYWQSRWMIQNDYEKRVTLMNEVADAYLDGKLHPPPVQVFHLSEIAEALDFVARQSEATIRSKVVFDCREA